MTKFMEIEMTKLKEIEMTTKLSRWRLFVALALVFALVAAACGDDDDSPVVSDTEDAPVEGDDPAVEDTDDDASAEEDPPATEGPVALADLTWDELVAQAQEEGEVSWFQWFLQPEFRPLVEAFEAEYGIDVTVPDGTFDSIHDKFLAESGRDSGDIDVMSTWAPFIEKSDIDALFTPLLSPDLDVLVTAFGSMDSEGTAAAFWGNQTGFAYNPDLISEDELPNTIEEMEAWMQANPKRFGFNEPEGGGAGPSFVFAVIRSLAGDSDAYFGPEVDPVAVEGWDVAWDWFNDNSDNFVITGTNADNLTRLNDGEFTIVTSYEDLLFSQIQQGSVSADLKFYVPAWGSVGSRNFVVIPQNAPNPAAAQLFVHWLTSAETQTTFNSVFGSSPSHPDADDSNSLVSAAERELQTLWPSDPYYDYFTEQFVELVVN